MSEPFPPPQPLPYASPTYSAKPTSVMVIGIIGIVLGAIGTLCTPIGLFSLIVPKNTAQPNPMIDLIQSSFGFKVWTIASTLINTVLAILLLSASIGSVMLARWARSGMVGYAWARLAMTVFEMAVFFGWVLPALLKNNPFGPSGSTAANAGAIGGIVGGVIGLIIAMILPVCILIFFRKRHVIEAFERGNAMPY